MEYQKFNSRLLSLCLGAMCCPIMCEYSQYLKDMDVFRDVIMLSCLGPCPIHRPISLFRQELECILTAVGAIQSAFTNWLLATLEIYQLPSSMGKLCQWFVHLYLYEL